MKVLVAIDRKSCVDEMIEFLKAYSLPAEAVIKVIHAIEPSTSFYSWPSEQYKSEVNELMDYARKRLSEFFPKLQFETSIVEGNAKDKILEVSEEFGADLILVGSVDKSGIKRFFGNVPSAIVLQAPCSVIVLGDSYAKAASCR